MSDKPKVHLAAIGMVTPLGASAESTAAMVRAGVSACKYTGFYLEEDDYIRMGLVPDELLENCLSEERLTGDYKNRKCTMRQIRLLQLAKVALTQLLPNLPKNVELPLFIAGPEPMVAGERLIDSQFIENLASQSGASINLAMSRVISTGRAAGLSAVNLAFRLFENSENNLAIVAGVDTFYDWESLQLLQQEDRLLGGGCKDGFIPGEGAAFLLVSKQKIALSKGNTKSICLYEAGTGNELGHRKSQHPYRGDGLAGALTAALNNAQIGKVKTMYSSMNGENFFAKEHGVALIRNSHLLDENISIEHPADCFGDLGAAFGPVAMGILAIHLLKNNVDSPCVICCSSDRESRSAMVMNL